MKNNVVCKTPQSVLVIVPSFDSGGTISSLINFVSLIDKTKYCVSVFAITNTGSNKRTVAEQCFIIGDGEVKNKENNIKSKLRNCIFSCVKKLKKGLCYIGIDISRILFRYYASKIDKGCYDFVLAFQEGQATLFGSYFRHGIKIAWVRSEYSRFLTTIKDSKYSKVYDRYDRIVSVSKASMNSFLGCLPQYREKAVVQYNFINDSRVLNLSSAEIEDLEVSEQFTIISLGRLDPIKRVSEIPRIASNLNKKGLSFRWILVGGAVSKEEYNLLLSNIQKYNVTNVLVLGNKPNPYPYVRNSDLLVSLSKSETFNNTLTEAKILGVPVVTTNYPCAYESILDGEEGLIDSFENVEESIFRMVTNQDGIYSRIKEVLRRYKYNNQELLLHLYREVLK